MSKIVTLALALALAQSSVQANLPKAKTGEKPAAAKSGTVTAGRLTADGPVLVNGHKAYTGETVFSGAVLSTPQGVGATVQMGALGQLDLAPGTSLTLSFASGEIRGALNKGCAILSARQGVNGVLVLPRGVTKRTAEAGAATINACADDKGGELATTGAKSTRLGRGGALNLGGASIGWSELGSMLAGSSALAAGLNAGGGTVSVNGATGLGCGGCCCCCCCNPSPCAPSR